MPKRKSTNSSQIEMRHEPQSWLSRGYGLAPQLIMMDRSISVGAKALFCYISSIAGSASHPDFGGPASWPSRDRICADLGIGKDTFTKYLRELREAGYIRVEQARGEGERFARNVYVICDIIYPPDKEGEKPCPKKPDTGKPDTELPDTENADTNSIKSLTNNNKKTKTRQDKTGRSVGPDGVLIDGKRLDDHFELYVERSPTESERRSLRKLAAQYSMDWVESAFVEYLVQDDLQGVKAPIPYIRGVLENWSVEGMRMTDVIAHLRRLPKQEAVET